jgi:uncharacterized protein
MTNSEAIEKTVGFIKQKFANETTGHDWWHMYRVWKLAKYIGQQEPGVNMLVVELGALLHDIADWKFHDDEEAGPKAAREWLESIHIDNSIIEQVEDIIRNVSFKGAKVENKLSKEGQIIWDADKLDAIGAIGIARAFSYGGSKGNPMYEPDRKAVHHDTFEAYKNDKTGTINHFDDKLLLLKDKMFTNTGKRIAEHRHEVMENYLKEFYAEWEAKL